MKNIFTKHPHSVGESYFEHLRFASQFGANMFLASCACFIHAICPFLFTQTGSNILFKMTQKLVDRKPSVSDKFSGLITIMENKKTK